MHPNPFAHVPPGTNIPSVVNAIVEIPKGRRSKFEVDKKTGLIRLDRFKVLGVPHTDPLFAEFQDLDDVPQHFLREVEHFFATYKQLEGVKTEPLGWAPASVATAEVRASVERYLAKKG